jgi:hypothetical protein
MITFECPRCHQPVDALAERATVSCEHCGEIVEVPRTSDLDTLTLDELAKLRGRKKNGGTESGDTDVVKK